MQLPNCFVTEEEPIKVRDVDININGCCFYNWNYNGCLDWNVDISLFFKFSLPSSWIRNESIGLASIEEANYIDVNFYIDAYSLALIRSSRDFTSKVLFVFFIKLIRQLGNKTIVKTLGGGTRK